MLNSLSVAPPIERRSRPRRVPPGYYSVAGLARVAPVGRSAIYAAIRERKLPACIWRGRIVVPEAAARQWLAVVPLDVAATDGGVAQCSVEAGDE